MKKFIRSRAPSSPTAAAPHGKTNGHVTPASGAAPRPGPGDVGDDLSTLSRYRSASEQPGAGDATGGPATLWEDSEFPAPRRSRFAGKEFGGDVVWLRPHEMAGSKWRGGAAGSVFADGNLRAAAGALTLAPASRLLARVLPDPPPHPPRADRTGIYRFRFWVFGEWRDVTVDDRLPTRGGRLLGAPPAPGPPPRDFTLPLLEKAYAKLYGSYTALRAGSVERALQDLTGGVVQSFALASTPRALTAQVLRAAVPRATLLVAVPSRGGPACCLTGLARVRGEDALLVRVRAAGDSRRSGAWTPGGVGWSSLPAADRDLLARRTDSTGDFWMSLDEVYESFGTLVLVHVGPDEWVCEPALRARRPWRAVVARRRWRRGYNAGGRPGSALADANPQFRVRAPDPCHALVSLTQRYAPGAGRVPLAVGVAVYALPADAGAGRAALAGLRALDAARGSRAREVVTLFALPAGQYLLVPHTRRAHAESTFLLRIYTDEPAHVWEVNEDNAAAAAVEPCEGCAAGGEVDAARMRRMRGAPPLEVCRALVPLQDAGAVGAVCAQHAASLVALAVGWRRAYRAQAPCGARSASAYRARALLRAVGVSVSNKVLECLVTRFARGAALPLDAFLLALARLHLAHERHRSLSAKLKWNPLSLEEMILMTMYS